MPTGSVSTRLLVAERGDRWCVDRWCVDGWCVDGAKLGDGTGAVGVTALFGPRWCVNFVEIQ